MRRRTASRSPSSVECGARVEARTCDVTDRAAIEDAFAGALQAFGRVDGCFANAGMGSSGRQPFVERSEDEWRRMFATNLDGVFHVFQVALRHMIKRAASGDRFGRIVATSSLASLFGMPRGEHYAATKAALNELIRTLAVEHARYGVTANAILPGWIETDMTAGLTANEKFVGATMPRIPMRRFGNPADFGGIAVYLMSELSSYHTGRLLGDRRRLQQVLSASQAPRASRSSKAIPLWERQNAAATYLVSG